MLLCPSFFDGRRDGIGRVSGAFHEGMARRYGAPPFVLSANDPAAAAPKQVGRCFDRRYWRMAVAALVSTDLPRSEKMPLVSIHLGLSPAARVLARRQGKHYAVFLHGVECWRPLRLRARWGLQGAARLFFNSYYTRDTFFRCNPWAAGQDNTVIPLGIPLSLLSQRKADDFATSALSHERPLRVLCVGRMSKSEFYLGFRDGGDLYKGFKQLILAVGRVADAGHPIRLEIIGDGDARPELESWLASRPESKIVQLLGRVSDERLAQAYRENDVFSLPSEGEGFGLVFAEAMAQGLPCVCVGAGAAPEVVTNEVTGLVARPRDVEDLASKLQRLATDSTLRARLSAAALRRATDFYAYDKFLARIDAALAELDRSSP
jgi:glycosyltransferase involved in cell wall biosynthesis